ncbi:hypothetical protein C7G41_30835 [Bradyrhizobium sp. MOS002]|nr:hypothetical protein C7G41_30835 [Bradyrhizobium sp. MOS002]
MGNGRSTCTGLSGRAMLQSDSIRRFSTRLGSEAIREGQALGYQLEEVLHLPAETIAGLARATKRDARPRPAALFGFQIHFLRAAPRCPKTCRRAVAPKSNPSMASSWMIRSTSRSCD